MNILAWTPVPGNKTNIYRTVAPGGLVCRGIACDTNKLIGTVPPGVGRFADSGQAGTTSIPTANTTGNVVVGGGLAFSKTPHTQTGGGTLTINPHASVYHQITVTDNNAFTMGPTAAVKDGQFLIINISNQAGGAMGNITWDASFHLDATGFTKPANGFNKSIMFICVSGAVPLWYQISPATADVAN